MAKTLTYDDLLKIPLADECKNKGDDKALRKFLVRKLYSKKLSDTGLEEPFIIESQLGTLEMGVDGAQLNSNMADNSKVFELFEQLNKFEARRAELTKAINDKEGQTKSRRALLEGAITKFSGQLKFVNDETFLVRTKICNGCEQWNHDKCAIGKFGITRLRLENSKCPESKW